MGKAATDIYTFENLRKRGYTYVDKTAILKELVDDSRGAQFFIARPRRFGKSLAVSTLKCLFEVKAKDGVACSVVALGNSPQAVNSVIGRLQDEHQR